MMLIPYLIIRYILFILPSQRGILPLGLPPINQKKASMQYGLTVLSRKALRLYTQALVGFLMACLNPFLLHIMTKTTCGRLLY